MAYIRYTGHLQASYNDLFLCCVGPSSDVLRRVSGKELMCVGGDGLVMGCIIFRLQSSVPISLSLTSTDKSSLWGRWCGTLPILRLHNVSLSSFLPPSLFLLPSSLLPSFLPLSFPPPSYPPSSLLSPSPSPSLLPLLP